jgi:hypothetical protein
MTFLDELLPIFNKNRRPASACWDILEFEKRIREQDRIEDLANKSINKPNSKRLYLEPLPHELFKFTNDSEDEEMDEVAFINEDQIVLEPFGHIDFLDESDTDTIVLPTEFPTIRLNISEYRQRRQKLENTQSLNLILENDSTSIGALTTEPVVKNGTTQTAMEHVQFQRNTIDLTSKSHTASSETQIIIPPSTKPTATTLFANLYDVSLIDSNIFSENAGPKIYAYPENIIPIFATPTQQSECDKDLSKDIRFYKVDFQHSLDVLSLPVNNDITESGKGLFFKNLLTNLQDRDLTLAFVTAHFNEECLLSDTAKQMGLKCDRFSNILTVWEADYGVCVETKPVDALESLQRKFKPVDFVISLGATVDSKTIKKMQAAPETPVAWMITLGSVEQRLFDFMNQHQIQYPEIVEIEGFKELLQNKNEWPSYNQYTFQQLTSRVANHVSGWLNLPSNSVYQFRSIEKLPLSYHLASFKVQTQEDVEDMDISSDTEEFQAIRQVFHCQIYLLFFSLIYVYIYMYICSNRIFFLFMKLSRKILQK